MGFLDASVSDKHSSLLRYGIIYARKKFMILASGVNVAVADGRENKLERWSTESFFTLVYYFE